MDFITNFKIIGSGLTAQRAKMDVVTSNLANVNTTRTAEGGPYKRKVAVLGSEEVAGGGFGSRLKEAIQGVAVKDVVEDDQGFKKVYDPSHPDADKSGYLTMPNVNVVSEMADMIVANRAYEACITAFDASKNMAVKTLDIGK